MIFSDTLDSWDDDGGAFDPDEFHGDDDIEEDEWYDDTQEELESGWYWDGEEV